MNLYLVIQQDEPVAHFVFQEDWQLSQFWVSVNRHRFSYNPQTHLHLKYTDETADALAEETIKQSDGGKIGCLCTPSIFR